MIYVVVRKDKESGKETCCLTKADSNEQALKITGATPETATWAAFTDYEARAILDTLEGYVTSQK